MTTTADDVWKLLAELVEAPKETERCFQETEQRFQETERILKEQSLKTDRQITRVSQEIGNLGGKWGRFVENMVAPACETLFLNRQIPVHQVSQRVRKRLDGKTLEIDVLVTNENHVLVVEVKGDGVFIRLRKEEVVCEDKDSSTRVSFSDVHKPVVEKVVECSGSEVERLSKPSRATFLVISVGVFRAIAGSFFALAKRRIGA